MVLRALKKAVGKENEAHPGRNKNSHYLPETLNGETVIWVKSADLNRSEKQMWHLPRRQEPSAGAC